MIFVYPIAIPFMYWWLLKSKKDDINPPFRMVENKSRDFAIEQQNDIAKEIQKKILLQYEFEEEDKSFEDVCEKVKDEHRSSNDQIEYLGFLYDSYKPSVWWWEVFDSERRLFLTGMLVFFLDGTAVQIVIAMIISFLSFKIYSYYQPYLASGIALLSDITQYQIFFTLFGALLIKVNLEKEVEHQNKIIDILLVIIFFLPVGAMLLILFCLI